jgi:murein DD-endopeptidase MepM/ murein hydrolase activator NlpD
MLAARSVVPAVLAGALLAAAPAPAAEPRRLGDRVLARGAHGGDVRELQRTLNRLRLRTRVDGAFGSATERAVRRYERRERLAADGRVSAGQARGMRLRAGTLAFGARVLRRGAHGGDVRRLQRVLTQLGVRTPADGTFGAGTERNVERYERAARVRADGVVDRAQAEAMVGRLEGGPERAPATAPAGEGARAFPIAGPYRFGDAGSGFGERGGAHRGVDVFAGCGTPLVAAEGGRVVFVGHHAAAGHYVVIRGRESGEDHVYMHLRARTPLARSAPVAAGAPVGHVGRTGNATACHLHFEIWTAPGWYDGGAPYDPRPSLDRWRAGA